MLNWFEVYKQKLVTADEAVKCIESGDIIEFTQFNCWAYDVDAALAKRKDELEGVTFSTTLPLQLPAVYQKDPNSEHFSISEITMGATTREWVKCGGKNYVIPCLFHEQSYWYHKGLAKCNVLVLNVTPMDKSGYFTTSVTASYILDILESRGGHADHFTVIAEVNQSLPKVGGENIVHIRDIDYVVESTENRPLSPLAKIVEGDDMDRKIAQYVVDEMSDGVCLQLGVGGMPNIVGRMVANSDLKDVGCHTELFCDSFMYMAQSGVLTNRRKSINKNKSVFTLAFGSKELYEFMDGNPSLMCMPVGYVNDPKVIAQNEKLFSICSCINVDYYGNVSSESVGWRTISNTGGQLDYHFASMRSNGGQGYVCMHSTRKNKDGAKSSNIIPSFEPGTRITVPANITNNVVTEYGIAHLKGKLLWDRTEALIKIAHPDFREDIIKKAEKFGIWKSSNKR